MWFGRRLLQEALDATRTFAEQTRRDLEKHVEGCNRTSEALRRELAQREERAQDWRKGLGEDLVALNRRLDSQDSQMRRIFYAVIGVLLAVIGYLMDHAGIFPHHP